MSGLFREKPLERISSPDRLDDYIRISNPGMWIILVVILLLVTSGIVWGFCATITETEPGVLVVQDNAATCYVERSHASRITSGNEIVFQSDTGMITSVSDAPQPLFSVVESTGQPEARFRQVLGNIDWVYEAQAAIDLPEGIYDVVVVIKTYTPFALIFEGARS